MKNLLFTFGLVAVMLTSAPSIQAAGVFSHPIQLSLVQPGIEPGTDWPRSPIEMPQVAQEGHSLYFFDGIALFVNLYEIDETGVGALSYSTFVSSETSMISLPTTLQGTYAIEGIRGNLHFWGEIEL